MRAVITAVSPDDHSASEGERRIRITVFGEVFEIVSHEGQPGHYDYDWISSPNPDYGFSSRSSDGRELEMRDHVDSIRNFLSLINPKTGLIE